MARIIGCITQQHDLRLVALAAVICVLACGTTLSLAARAQTASRRSSLVWLIAPSVVFGCGVWSLHFVAMLAFEPNIPIFYNLSMTGGSVLVAVAGALSALLVWSLCSSRTVAILAGGSLLGASVTAMHYCGVMAMHVPGRLRFDLGEVVASVVVSIVFAILALARSESLASYRRRLEVTGWLTLSICGMHFTAMAALSIDAGQPGDYDGIIVGSGTLAIAVGSVSLAILIVSLAATIMEQHLSQRAVLELNRMRLLSDISQEILIVHRDGIILHLNAAGSRMFGQARGTLVGSQVLDLIEEGDRPAVVRRQVRGGADLNHEEIQVHTAAGTLASVEFSCTEIDYEGKPAITMALRDVTDRNRNEARIRHLAHHDALTDLPNRFLLRERLTQARDALIRSKATLALLYLDLDHFKPVNDLLGHAHGDALLIQVAKRLRAELRPTDTLARIGGDEFVIVATFDHAENVATMAARLTETLARPFDLGGHQVQIGTSVGIAVYPADGDGQQALMRAADAALYRAKQEGRGTFRFFEPSMDEHLQARQKLQQDLRWALERGQFQVHYQPLVTCATGEIEGFEALLRWKHPERGLVPPLEFIPLAEETGLIARIGEWVLETACATAAGWKEPRWVAVNVSPVQFRQPDLTGMIAGILDRTGLPPNRLEIEITEGVLVEDAERAAKVLSVLRSLGVRIALDDFGTGYSSLSYLHAIRFDKIKIDKSFIDRLGESEDTTIIVRTIIGLAHNLGLTIVAEGVETAQQLAIIREFFCDQVQGYLLGRPQVDGPAELVTARARMLLSAGFKLAISPDPMDAAGCQSDAEREEVGIVW